jgi:hypothetical protein
VIGNENRGCIGCHENRELSPPNVLVNAVTKPVVDLSSSMEERRTVDFRHQIAPIVKLKCATDNCHITGKTPPNLENRYHSSGEASSRHIFDTLLKKNDENEKTQFVYPGNARESRLIKHLLGIPIASVNALNAKIFTPIPPEKQLSEEERILFIEWIDTGAFWDLRSLKMFNSHHNQNK